MIPHEQAGFRHGRPTVVDQVTLLTQNIEDRFTAENKAGAAFVDPPPAYNTIRHRELIYKLFHLRP